MSAMNPPVLRVIRGDATDEEVAALLAVVSARTNDDADPPARPTRSAWTDRSTLTRRPVHPGPGAWQASGWPR